MCKPNIGGLEPGAIIHVAASGTGDLHRDNGGSQQESCPGGRPAQDPKMGDDPNVLVGAKSTEDRALHDSTPGGVKVAPNGDQVSCWRGGSGCERDGETVAPPWFSWLSLSTGGVS